MIFAADNACPGRSDEFILGNVSDSGAHVLFPERNQGVGAMGRRKHHRPPAAILAPASIFHRSPFRKIVALQT
jgi:hypothetical protein